MNFIYELAEVKVWQIPPATCSSRAVTHHNANPAEQGSNLFHRTDRTYCTLIMDWYLRIQLVKIAVFVFFPIL